jgi:hypothetical protein
VASGRKREHRNSFGRTLNDTSETHRSKSDLTLASERLTMSAKDAGYC